MAFNFPTERMVPMSADIEEKIGGLIKDGDEFTLEMEIKKEVFFKAVSEGLGWAINTWPEIKKIGGPYDVESRRDLFRIDCVCKFDSRDALKTTEAETCFHVPEDAFNDALAFGLNTIMGNVSEVMVKNIWSFSDSADVVIKFKAKEPKQ